MLARLDQLAPVRQYLDRIEELEEQVRQLRTAFAPKVGFPLSWALEDREGAILSALFSTSGSYITAEALRLLIVGFDDNAGEGTVQLWVGRLRRKVGRHGIRIETRNHQGYALEASSRVLVAEALGQVPVTSAAGSGPWIRPHAWTDAEDAIVRAGYDREATLAVIRIELLGAGFQARSFGSISTRAQTLGLTSVRASSLWTAPEDEILREGYEAGELITVIRRKLAEAGFTRKRGAIQMRAISLGISGNRVRPWTRTEKAIVRRCLDAGDTYDDIRRALAAKGFERGRTGVAKMARFMGSRRSGAPWTEEHLAILKERCAAKVPHRRIAEELGRPVSSVQDKASDCGFLQRIKWTDADRRRLIEGHADGEDARTIAAAIGRPHTHVQAEASRQGLRFGRGGAA